MDDESPDESSLSSVILSSRQRDANFTPKEVSVLVGLVEKYKYILCNSYTNRQSNKRKEDAWTAITKKFNDAGYTRSPESLKTKWENLKRDARKLAKNPLELARDKYSSVFIKVNEMILEVENNPAPNVEDFEESGIKDSKSIAKSWENSSSSEECDENEASTRHRSPIFKPEEAKALVDLVFQHRHLILNKSTTGSVNHTKEVAWAEISKQFNSNGFACERSVESLKNKWENLKRKARHVHRSMIDLDYHNCDELNDQIIKMLQDVESFNEANGAEQATKGEFDNGSGNMHTNDTTDVETESNNHDELSFSPQECKILLQCVRAEKKNVFTPQKAPHSVDLRNRAWVKIAHAFNKQSPKRKSVKVLRSKFQSMRKLANSANVKKYFNLSKNPERLIEVKEENSTVFKTEPTFDYNMESAQQENDDEDSPLEERNDSPASDPLSIVLNCDSGIGVGANSHIEEITSPNKDYAKLRLQLLNYQIETAKMERKRIEDAIEADKEAREVLAIERSLRLRAARLSTIAAESQLPSTHYALAYTAEEARAQQYLMQHRNS